MTKYTYELKQTENPVWEYIERSDGARIPLDEGNADYQAYLKRDEVEDLTEIVPGDE